MRSNTQNTVKEDQYHTETKWISALLGIPPYILGIKIATAPVLALVL